MEAIKSQLLTFDQLPQVVLQVSNDIIEMKRLLQQLQEKSTYPHDADKWYDLDELVQYLPDHPAKATLYPKLASGEFPGHKRGKKWYFLKSEVDKFLREGRKRTLAEIDSDVDNYLSRQ